MLTDLFSSWETLGVGGIGGAAALVLRWLLKHRKDLRKAAERVDQTIEVWLPSDDPEHPMVKQSTTVHAPTVDDLPLPPGPNPIEVLQKTLETVISTVDSQGKTIKQQDERMNVLEKRLDDKDARIEILEKELQKTREELAAAREELAEERAAKVRHQARIQELEAKIAAQELELCQLRAA